jgi:hypothetical protein
MDGEQLIMTIAKNKETNREEAKKAFELFCGYYQERVTQMAVVHCRRWKKSEDYACVIVQCAFDKVWQYPTFEKGKTLIKDTDKAILHWIDKILYHEMSLFSEKGNCSHPEPEDLPIITSTEVFIDEFVGDDYLSEEQYDAVKKQLDDAFSVLSEQEVTVYLTYKLYLKMYDRVPQRVLKKLRARYGITQDAIKHCKLRVEQKLKEV